MNSRGEVEMDTLWEGFCAHRTPEIRDQLILHYAPLVKRVANRLGLVASAALDHEDLISHGLSGLIEAVDRFDPSRGIAFETFASQRIRGSILDALRAMDHLPRSLRRRSTEIERAIADLRARLERSPTDAEVAHYLRMDVEAYRQVLGQVNIVFLSLDSPFSNLQNGGEELALSEVLEDPAVQDTMTEIEEQDLRLELAEAIQELPEREQLVLSLYYYEELTVREVGEVMSLSASRVSQLMSRAIMTLRARMLYDRPSVRGKYRTRPVRLEPLAA